MSRTDENRRPVRVLPPAEVSGGPRPPAATQAADRFQRTLAGARRIEPPADRARPAAEPKVERAAERAPQPFVAPSVLAHDIPLQEIEATPGPETTASRDETQSHEPRSQPPAIEPIANTDTGRWTEDTAQKIALLCARADASFAHWSVTLPMDPQTLPETDLVLSLSPYGLSLRFRTQSALSSRLIDTHKPRLQALLGRTRGLPQDVAIEVS